MSLSRFLSEQREKQIVSNAHPYMAESDEVVYWVHAKHPEKRRQGYAYVTREKIVVHWSGKAEGSCAFDWDDVVSWGVDKDARGGPLLGLVTKDVALFIQCPVDTRGMANRTQEFLQNFAELAPEPRHHVLKDGHEGEFVSEANVEVQTPRRNAIGKVQRIVATALGIVLIVGGILIMPLPGPWSLPIIITGLAILGSEYDWATDIMNWTRERAKKAKESIARRRSRR